MDTGKRVHEWQAAIEDPVRAAFVAARPPGLDFVLGLFPRPQGDPAFDPGMIAARAEKIETYPNVVLGHPLLDAAVKIGLAHIDATFQGDHPKYGVKVYANPEHDAFPPTIIAAVDALSAWGRCQRAAELLRYWLATFVRDDGTIDYYGPSISEYGQLLHTAACLIEQGGMGTWWVDGFPALERLAGHLLVLCEAANPEDGLIAGSPEADECAKTARYFHNNAWAAKGLRRWAEILDGPKTAPASADRARKAADRLAGDTLAAIRRTWPEDPADPWLPPQVEPLPRPDSLTGHREASYTNYRYWPELLSSGLLPPEMAERLVQARWSFGGQFCGMTRFCDWLDDWPLADYLEGLWALGHKEDFLLSLYGHIAYHQAEGHLTAYEQVTFPPGTEKAAYCLPCQLVAPRAARRLIG